MPNWLTALFSSLSSTTTAFTATAVREQLTAFQTFLTAGTNPIVRFWVEAGASKGHTAATANLVYRLARPVDVNQQNFGYNGTIEIYYEADPDLVEIRRAIPELTQQPPMIDGATLAAIKWVAKPAATVTFGFTGGLNKGADYTDKLNLQYFLRLQPYRWSGTEEIQRSGQSSIDLTTIAQLGPGFKDRLFYMTPSLYAKPPFDDFPNDENIKIVKLITSAATLGKFQLLTAYSIKSLNSRLNANPVYGASLVVGSVMSWQKQGDDVYGKAKPAIIVNYDVFGTPGASEEAEVRKVLKGELATSENGLDVSLNARTPDATLVANVQRRKAFFVSLDSENRFTYLNYPATVEAVSGALAGLEGRNDQVVFIQLGNVPPAFFSYSVVRSTLPALFEGQNAANLAINTGVPYMQVPAPNMSTEDRLTIYPSVTLRGLNPDTVPLALSKVATQISSGNAVWPALASEAPCLIVGDYYRQYTDEDPDNYVIHRYFITLNDFFAQPAKDKFVLAVAYLNFIRPPALLLAAAPAVDNPLNALYTKLQAAVTIGQPLDLVPGILTEGIIPGYIQSLLTSFATGLTLTVKVFDHKGEPPNVTSILLQGPTPAFASLGVTCDVRVMFTAPDGKLTADILFTDTQTWTMPSVPWIVLRDPFVSIEVTEEKLPVLASFGGYYPALESKKPPITAKLEVSVANPDQWPASISFEQTYPSIASAFQMAASVNLVQSLPAPFNVLTDLGVSNVELQYDYTNSVLLSILITAKSNTQNLPLFGTLTLSNITVATTILRPVTTRELAVSAAADFSIGAKDPAIVGVSVSYPGLTLQGELKAGVITIEKLLSTFLPDYQLSLPQVPAIDQFSFNYNRTTDYLTITLNLNIQWTLSFFGRDLFKIENAGFAITRAKGTNTGFVTGNTVLLPATAKIGVTIGAYYSGSGNWRFEAKQTSGVVDLDALLTEYLDPKWVPPIKFPQLDGLGVSIDWVHGAATAFEFTAKTATKWTPITVLPDVTVTGQATIGYKRDAALLTAASASQDLPGAYGRIAADITLWNIALHVEYNFDPQSQQLCIEWLALKACLTKKGEDTIAVFTLNGKSIGEMVEMFVSWATGARFGLSAPWNLLDAITLNGFSVEYNFSKSTVKFHVGIGPMDFGIFTLKGVSLDYDPTSKDRKVQIKIDGSFTWEPNKDSLDWDPTKPESTPAPPGGGNKYLDLRLLALGQHVTVAGLTEQRQVQDVIKMLRDLKVPSPPDIPVGGAGQPILAPRNSWFVAFDFGVLKVEEKKPPPQTRAALTDTSRALALAEAPAPPAVYFMQLSVVFNDPILYALQIALDGPMAKIFAGLNFQIMYRQVSDTTGCYSAQIALPNIMRKFQVGIATITLPIFGIEIYTNGDFQVDIGFPWKMDFSRSFTIEAIVAPGIPILGSAGFYFGKLSSATTDKVPAASNGWFNPVIVFGFGAQLGLGKSIEMGILRAGFSLTVFGIIEGVLARWLPYIGPTPPGQLDSLQDGYYFALTGTVGVQGRLYGTVDFAIIKADVDVAISIYIRFAFIAYKDITIDASASVRIKVSISIDLGLFSITISFSFSATVEASFLLPNPMGTNAPWIPKTAATAVPALQQRRVNRLLRAQGSGLLAAGTTLVYNPIWSHLTKGDTQVQLQGWVAPVLTVAGDEAATPSEQLVCYVANFFLPVPPPVQSPPPQSAKLLNRAAHIVDERGVAHVALARARQDTPVDTFEDLAIRVLEWVIAAGFPKPMPPAEVQLQIVSADFLSAALTYLSGATTPTPVPAAAIESFLTDQTQLLFALASGSGTASGVFFPAPPGTTLTVPKYPDPSGPPVYSYAFGDYNTTSSGYLGALNTYFNELRVQVQAEQPAPKRAAVTSAGPSIASYIFGDYFALLGRQTVQALLDGLKHFKMVIDPSLTVKQTVDWVNQTGNILDPKQQITAAELFHANAGHLLSAKAAPPLTISGMTWRTPGGRSLQDISTEAIFARGFDGRALAVQNALDSRILAANIPVIYQSRPYVTLSGDSLETVADYFTISIDQLLDGTDVVTNPALLSPLAIVTAPDFSHAIAGGDTLSTVAARFGVSLDALAGANLDVAGLFDAASDPNLNVPELVQFRVKELIDEAKRTLGLQNVGAMTSRFYLHGLRLPTEGLTANAAGLFVTGTPGHYEYPDTLGLFALTGQAFPLPDIPNANPPFFNFTLTRGANETWLNLGAAGSDHVLFQLSATDDFTRYKSVKDSALASRLRTGMSGIVELDAAATQPSRFPLSQQVFWQTPAAVTLPVQTVTPPTPQPSLWLLPDSLINLPNSNGLLPRIKPVIARTDTATSSTVEQPVANFGFGTLITFSLRRTPPVAGAPTTDRFYELIGATERDTILLERLLDQVKSDNGRFQQMTLCYPPASTSSEVTGWQSDDPAVTLMGIGQVNLSTETRPPTALAALAGRATQDLANVINPPTELLRLLWEASITRQGGFYLSYSTAIGSSQVKGLPDRIFNSNDVAEVAVLSLFKADIGDGQFVANYMNVAATNQQLDLSSAALIAEVATVPLDSRPFLATDTLDGLAAEYYTDLSLIASMNLDATLAGGVVVPGGRYVVPPAGVAPGGDLNTIAVYFNTTATAIQDANPYRRQWPSPLPQYTGLILPAVTVRIGTDPGGTTFQSLHAHYHAPVAGIAAANSTAPGLIANNQTLKVLAGPLTLAPLVPAGVTGFHCSRNAPAQLPAPSDAAWGRLYLLNLFNLLGYRVADTPDFRASAWGLPAGPAAPASQPAADKIQAPQAAGEGDDWIYTRTLPYPKLYKHALATLSPDLPAASDSPYLGVGGLMQIELAWQDVFGNRILTELSEPQTMADTPLNLPPQITGYADRLLAVGQWPAVANAFYVMADAQKDPILELHLVFDTSQFEVADAGQRIRHAIAIYGQILYQLGDPNGVAISLTTTVTPTAGSLLSSKDEEALLHWVENIYLWLNSLLPPLPPPPPDFKPNLTLGVPIDVKKINTDQIFRVSASMTISRNPRLVEGELSTAAGVTAASTTLAPWTGPLSDEEIQTEGHARLMATAGRAAATDQATAQRDISAFAKAFTGAFSKIPGVTFHIATGSDRNAFTSGATANLWAVQLGTAAQSTPISYAVTNPGAPKQYAPRPISNQLVSRPTTAIIQYQTGKVIDLADPSINKSFLSIDLDQWMQFTVTQTDALLTPRYVAPALILRQKRPGTDSLQKVLTAKKALAGALKTAMIPVFDGETATDPERKAIQEVFYQSLLGLVGQFYAVKVGVQFSADVHAAIAPQPGDVQPPRLYGDIDSATVTRSAAAASPAQANVSLSSPKLNLRFAGGDTDPRYLSFLVSSTTSEASIPLKLEYSCQYVEQEIGKLSGIDGYQPSSWLSFADDTTAADWPLNATLGEFEIPIVLRAFPETPTLVRHESVDDADLDSPCHVPAARVAPTQALRTTADTCERPGTYNPLAGFTLWNYAFDYSLQVHYLQDAVHGLIKFNLTVPRGFRALALPPRDLFDNLAEFTQVYPQVLADLNSYLAPLDVSTTDATQIQNAQAALESAANLIQWVADTAGGLGVNQHLRAAAVSSSAIPYPFTITEIGVEKKNPDGTLVEALGVVVALPAPPPPRVGRPLVQIQRSTYVCEPDGGDDQTFRFVYKDKTTGAYLTTDVGRTIAARTFVLPDLEVLERQDAEVSIYLTRNENLAGRAIAKVFVYTTPTVSAPDPLLPTLTHDQAVNLATIDAVDANTPVTRSLSCQLSVLYDVLFANAGTSSLTLTMTVYYAYSLSDQIPQVRLPVFLMPPTLVAIASGGSGQPIADVIAEQVRGCETWFEAMNPVTTDGTLLFDLTIMSNLTERPMPILHLSDLFVPLAYLNPPLGAVAREAALSGA